MQLHDLLDTGTVYQVRAGPLLAEGAQGQLFPLLTFPGATRPLVLKLYRVAPESQEGRRLQRLVQHLRSLPNLQKQTTLVLPLTVIHERAENRIGCILPFVPGKELSDEIYCKIYEHSQGLRGRLVIAQRIAAAVALLHQNGIVSADIAEPNILLDLSTSTPYHIDLDGGGVLASPLANSFQPGLEPAVRGHMEGSFLAPELIKEPMRLPSLASDRWSLAVLIHKLLFHGLDPYFSLPAFREVLTRPPGWPVAGCTSPPLNKYVEFHAQELIRLGPALKQLFKATFQAVSGTPAAARRPKAEEWDRDLRRALDWIHRCSRCREEFVAEGFAVCPFCKAILPQLSIPATRTRLSLNRQGQSLLGRDLGFKDREGRYVVARFGRRAGRPVMTPGIPLTERRSRRRYSPGQDIVLDNDRQTWTFLARSGDGHQQAEFEVHA